MFKSFPALIYLKSAYNGVERFNTLSIFVMGVCAIYDDNYEHKKIGYACINNSEKQEYLMLTDITIKDLGIKKVYYEDNVLFKKIRHTVNGFSYKDTVAGINQDYKLTNDHTICSVEACTEKFIYLKILYTILKIGKEELYMDYFVFPVKYENIKKVSFEEYKKELLVKKILGGN